MAEIIRPRERKYYERTEMCFYDRETKEIRYGFPMVKGKEMIPCKEGDELHTYIPCEEEECTWWRNYLKASENDSLYSRIEIYKSYYTEPAHAICECGREIALNFDAEECPYCGRLHNLFGQELRPRRYWERDWDDADDWCE